MKTFPSLKKDEQLVVHITGWVVLWFKYHTFTNGCSVVKVYRNGWFVANHPSLSSAITAMLKQSGIECGPRWEQLAEQAFVLALAELDIQRQKDALKLWMESDSHSNNFLNYCSNITAAQRDTTYDILTEDCG